MLSLDLSIQGATSDYQSSIASGRWMSNYSSSAKTANEDSVQADLTSGSTSTGVVGKPSMEEISARLSAKLALLEASQQVEII